MNPADPLWRIDPATGAVVFRHAPDHWSDDDLVQALRGLEDLIEKLSVAYQRLAAERDRRMVAYEGVAGVLAELGVIEDRPRQE
ncbi:hypothetical protein [Streptomyces sp. NPDC048392]|uniref:hypothetical protein n=1 Tax=Streptomyces sp. NPDC048392 TaxID=3365543 RepID=UPI0037189A4A